MKLSIQLRLIIIILLFTNTLGAQVEFTKYFKDKTMRFDFFHSGTSAEEHFAIDRIVSDGTWGGSQSVLIDELAFGPYFFEIVDIASEKTIFSRGFANIFGEWQTTTEASTQWGTIHESLRFPWPIAAFKLIIHKRYANNQFQKVYETQIDPNSRFVNPADKAHQYKTWAYLQNGPSHKKLDIVILGDGYQASQMSKFKADIKKHVDALFDVEPFKSRKNDFNVWVVETPGAVVGINKPNQGIFSRTPLSVSYGAFDSERYVLAFDNRAVREVASEVAYDFIFVMVNERTYGGGGIYNLYATVSTDNKFSEYIFVHEFGHHLAGLADEYYTSAVAYEAGKLELEPWEANITLMKDPDNLKWKNLVSPTTPIPTPWDKQRFDSLSYAIQKERVSIRKQKLPEEVMEALFEREKKEEIALLSKMQHYGKVGAFEGAGYNQFGMYRAEADCIMFTRNHQMFCRVCQQTLNEVIDQYSK